MLTALLELSLFTAKAIILVLLFLFLLIGIISILSRGKDKLKGRLIIKNLNKKLKETKEELYAEICPKDKFKKYLKEQKKADKKKTGSKKNLFVLNFHGDIKASAVESLREEVTAILGVATPQDEVLVKIESAGGMVHTYGLAASQLLRFKAKNIPLTVCVDKVAASGGYLMACVADKIIAAPFAIIGSIGVIVQLPNFNRLLKEKNIDFEQLTAGSFKRTLTMFGHNTPEGREKMQQEINDIHGLFKNLIIEHRPQLEINKVASGEHWLGSQALALNLVDELCTSDDYLCGKIKSAELYSIEFKTKKTFSEKITSVMNLLKSNVISSTPF